jgi:hypothetical protein
VFFNESEEGIALCPNCGELLEYHSWVTRLLKDKAGKRSKYLIRVLKCINTACPTKYHRELPDIIIPYKRYDTESIEEAIDTDNQNATVAADESTIHRWRRWFKENIVNIMMSLKSVTDANGDIAKTSSLENPEQDSSKPMEIIKVIVSRRVKWLNETVRILVNSSKWVFNRSAFLTG